jgi:hypothetical protein
MTPEKQVPRDTTDCTPVQPSLPRVRAKLKAGQPITLVTLFFDNVLLAARKVQ